MQVGPSDYEHDNMVPVGTTRLTVSAERPSDTYRNA